MKIQTYHVIVVLVASPFSAFVHADDSQAKLAGNWYSHEAQALLEIGANKKPPTKIDQRLL